MNAVGLTFVINHPQRLFSIFWVFFFSLLHSESTEKIVNVGEAVEKAMAPHSSTLAWKIPWTEKPGRLQSMGSLRVGHD